MKKLKDWIIKHKIVTAVIVIFIFLGVIRNLNQKPSS